MTEPSPRALQSAVFAAYLRRAMGLGLGVLGTASCGGNVVVDPTLTDGTGGGSTTTTGTTTTSSTVITCDVPATVYEAITQCVSPTPTGCAALGSASASAAVLEALQTQACGADMAAMLCGPTFNDDGQCCYVVDAMLYECGGRPFVIDGVARTAPIVARDDWRTSERAEAADLDETTRASLAAFWSRAALDEHAAVASFARFVLELLAVGAPAEIVASAQRALGDEITHAERCFALASDFGGAPMGPGPLPIGELGAARLSLASIAAATAREGCVGETIAAFVAAAASDEASDPAVRAALQIIARDEAEHAALAYRFVAWAVRRGGGRVRDAVAAAFEAAIASPPAPLPDADGDAALLRARGVLPSAERRALAARCLAEVIAPTARALVREIVAPAEEASLS